MELEFHSYSYIDTRARNTHSLYLQHNRIVFAVQCRQNLDIRFSKHWTVGNEIYSEKKTVAGRLQV